MIFAFLERKNPPVPQAAGHRNPMHEKKILKLVLGGIALLLAVFAAGFLAGHLRSNGPDNLQHGIRLESIRAEQRRTDAEYARLADNYARERELNGRIRTIVEDSTELLQSTTPPERSGYVVLIRYFDSGYIPLVPPQGPGYVPFATNQMTTQYLELGDKFLRLEKSYGNLKLCFLISIPAALLTGSLVTALLITK
jgi:hypothetical protein